MSMEIANNCHNYAAGYVNIEKDSGSKKEVTSTVELKTPVPGVTRTEQIKTGFPTVNAYSGYLQGKYSYMNTGTTSMQGIPATVSVSGAFLKRCMNDPEKAKYLEENLAAIPACVSYAASHAQGTLTSISYEIDANGNMTIMSSGTNDPDGKIARENGERKAKEKKAEEEKAAKRRDEKRSKEEKADERRAERKEQSETLEDGREPETFQVSVTGTDVKSITRSLTVWHISGYAATSFDSKA